MSEWKTKVIDVWPKANIKRSGQGWFAVENKEPLNKMVSSWHDTEDQAWEDAAKHLEIERGVRER